MGNTRLRSSILGLLVLTLSVGCGDDSNDLPPTDQGPPVVTISSSALTDAVDYVLTGTATDDVAVVLLSYTLNEDPIPRSMTVASSFSANLRLRVGPNTVRVEAMDAAGNTGSAQLEVKVTHPSAPIALDDYVEVDEDNSASIAMEAVDPDGDPLTFEVVESPGNGSLSGSPPQVTYTGNADFHGPDRFTFTASNGSYTSNTATVRIAVYPINDVPVAGSLADVAAVEDTPITVALAGSDVDMDTLAFLVADPPSHGTVETSGHDEVVYTPDTDYSGPDTFSFIVNDGKVDSAPGLVSIDIAPVNDPPVALESFVDVSEENPSTFRLQATDVDSDSLVFTVTTLPLHGTLDTSSLPRLTYTPELDYTGQDYIAFEVDDGEYSDTAIVTLNVLEGSFIYVAVDGDDTNSGLTAYEPLRSLDAALAEADVVGPGEPPDVIVMGVGRFCVAGTTIDHSVIVSGAGIDLTVLDGSTSRIDCIGAPVDAAVTIPNICAQRPGRSWPDAGVLEVRGTGNVPIEVTLSDLAVTNGYADGFGGGIDNVENLTLQRVAIQSNCARAGGGLSNRQRPDLPEEVDASRWGHVLLINSLVSSNGADTGAGLHNQGWMRVSYSYVEDNIAFLVDPQSPPPDNEYPGWGGGIFNAPVSTDVAAYPLDITISVVSENKAWGSGGGIASIGSNLDIVGSSITQNSAGTGTLAGHGGGLLAIGSDQERLELTMSDTTVHYNTATGAHGGMLLTRMDLDMTQSEVVGNRAPDRSGTTIEGFDWGTPEAPDLTTAFISMSRFDLNITPGIAGGLSSDLADLFIEESTISDNVANVAGGALFDHGEVTIEGSWVMRNTATYAGAIRVGDDADVELVTTLLNDNSATRHSGGIYNTGRLTLAKCSMVHNRARASTPGCDPTGETFCDPDSTGWVHVGGAIRNDFGELNLIERTRIDNNEAADAGAGIYFDGGTATVVKTTISANRAEDKNDDNRSLEEGGDGGMLPRGGGMYVVEGQVTFVESDVSGNVSEVEGAGIYNEGGDLVFSKTVMAGNLAEANEDSGLVWEIQRGGAIYNLADIAISDGYIQLNTAADQGAGIWTEGGTLTIDRTTFRENLATSLIDPVEDAQGEGGALWIDGIHVPILNSTFTGNLADRRGAAILVNTGSVSLDYVTAYENVPGEGHAAFSGGTYTAYATIIASSEGFLSCEDLEMSADLTMTSDDTCFGGSSGDATLFPDTDPMLEELDLNEGIADTHLPMLESPAIDAIPLGACRDPVNPTQPLTVDQRNLSRPIDMDSVPGALCDLGAVERRPEDSEEEDE